MQKLIPTKLIGGPLSGRSIEVDSQSSFGQIIEIPTAKTQSGNVSIETKHHYRIDPHPSEGVVLSWVNPADRRRYGH
jgi:hypothetical protein